MELSIVCTLIDDTHRHSGQNLPWTHSATPCESTTNFDHYDDVHSLLIKVETMLNHIYILPKPFFGISLMGQETLAILTG